jgi:sigma-B regulation protein RsbU (phosphoserine phosphatase)
MQHPDPGAGQAVGSGSRRALAGCPGSPGPRTRFGPAKETDIEAQRPQVSAREGAGESASERTQESVLEGVQESVQESAREASRLSRDDLEAVLAVTRALATPFDLPSLLAEVTAAAQRVLRVERASVWLLDEATDELVAEVSSDIRQLRVPRDRGLVGACASQRALVNVPDCYADARFDPAADRRSGFRSRCCLALPLVDHRGRLIGVMQLMNRQGGSFDADAEALGLALAAQCAVALSRVSMVAALVEAQKVQQELALARLMQQATLPASMPQLPGYEMHGLCEPASQTGGDTYDLALLDQGLLVMLGDATGHGVAPALSVTQMHAMLRMAFALGADLETAFRRVNDRMAEILPDGRFVTTFIGLLDPSLHRLRFLSGGQGPILHYRATRGACDVHRATSFPLGAARLGTLRPAVELVFEPGDWLALLSDGIYEAADPGGAQFGRVRVEELLHAGAGLTPAAWAGQLMQAVRAHTGAAPPDDDITAVLIRRST